MHNVSMRERLITGALLKQTLFNPYILIWIAQKCPHQRSCDNPKMLKRVAT